MADIYVACPRCGFPLNIIEPMRDALETTHEKILNGSCLFRLSCESCEAQTLEVEIRKYDDENPQVELTEELEEEKLLN